MIFEAIEEWIIGRGVRNRGRAGSSSSSAAGSGSGRGMGGWTNELAERVRWWSPADGGIFVAAVEEVCLIHILSYALLYHYISLSISR